MNNNNKKYEILPNDHIDLGNFKVYRIRALRDFFNVRAGDLGGYVESEHNLSHEGDCWIEDDATVVGNSRISGNALVRDHSWVANGAEICDNALISGWVEVSGPTKVSGDAHLSAREPRTSPLPMHA